MFVIIVGQVNLPVGPVCGICYWIFICPIGRG